MLSCFLLLFVAYSSLQPGAVSCPSTTQYSETVQEVYNQIHFTLGYSFVPSSTMKKLLKSFGAEEADFEEFFKIWPDLTKEFRFADPDCSELPFDPMFRHRKAVMVSSEFDYNQPNESIRSVDNVPICIPAGDIDPTSEIAGCPRAYPTLRDKYKNNTVLKALQELSRQLINKHEVAPAGRDGHVYEQSMFPAMILNSSDVPGNPSPEGVHSDNSEVNMVMLIGKKNVAKGSAQTEVWSTKQPLGVPREDDNRKNLITAVELTDPLDTIFVNDRKVLHQGSPIKRIIHDEEAVRAVVVMFTRRKETQEAKDAKKARTRLLEIENVSTSSGSLSPPSPPSPNTQE